MKKKTKKHWAPEGMKKCCKSGCGNLLPEDAMESVCSECAGEPATHTPGPWIKRPQSNGIAIVPEDDLFNAVCCIAKECENFKSNANIIAAAPELLEALKEVMTWTRQDISGFDDISPNLEILKNRKAMLKEAIAKAEGK